MDLLLNLRRTVNNFPDASAIIDGSVRMNWREYDLETRNVAAGLVELGARPGDRISILALNSYRYAILYYAVIRIGAILVPQNTRFSPAEHVYTLNDSGAIILIVDDTFSSNGRKHCPSVANSAAVPVYGERLCPTGDADVSDCSCCRTEPDDVQRCPAR